MLLGYKYKVVKLLRCLGYFPWPYRVMLPAVQGQLPTIYLLLGQNNVRGGRTPDLRDSVTLRKQTKS